MTSMTDRQRAIKERLDAGMGAREIAEDLGITRNAVYQQIQRLRRDGELPSDYTPTGQPTRQVSRPGSDLLARITADSSDGDGGALAQAGAIALAQELARVRDELREIVQRLSLIVPR